MRAATNGMHSRNLLVLDSREAILALAPLLEILAARCDQAGALHWLPYFLDREVLGQRAPRLVLLLGPEKGPDRGLAEDDLEAAALFFEYQLLGVSTGIVATGDAVGFNTVIAPEGVRAQVAMLAMQALLERGASMLMATFESSVTHDPRRWMLGRKAVAIGSRVRSVQRVLPLLDSLDQTLAQMGKSTRFNLRYYRRRLEKQVPCEFVADAAPLLRDAALEQMNAHSLNPVSPAEFQRRVAAASELQGSFLCGLRDGSGRWLSLIGGWRQGETTVLYWQMNCSGMEKHSIGTVMRSHFLEAEIGRGARSLLIYGGTPHSMRHAFLEDSITDFVVARQGIRLAALRWGAKLMLATRMKERGNFVLETLCDPKLQWHTGRPMREVPVTGPRIKAAQAQRVA